MFSRLLQKPARSFAVWLIRRFADVSIEFVYQCSCGELTHVTIDLDRLLRRGHGGARAVALGACERVPAERLN